MSCPDTGYDCHIYQQSSQARPVCRCANADVLSIHGCVGKCSSWQFGSKKQNWPWNRLHLQLYCNSSAVLCLIFLRFNLSQKDYEDARLAPHKLYCSCPPTHHFRTNIRHFTLVLTVSAILNYAPTAICAKSNFLKFKITSSSLIVHILI